MRNVLFAAVLLAAVSASGAAPAYAEPSQLDADRAPTSTIPAASAAPESPLAAFERLFARSVAVVVAPPAPAAVDPLDAPFHAALWSPPAPSKMSAAHAAESR